MYGSIYRARNQIICGRLDLPTMGGKDLQHIDSYRNL